MTLSKIQGLHESTKHHPKVYKGCLTPRERAIMAEIYKEAGCRSVRVTKNNASRYFNKYRKEF